MVLRSKGSSVQKSLAAQLRFEAQLQFSWTWNVSHDVSLGIPNLTFTKMAATFTRDLLVQSTAWSMWSFFLTHSVLILNLFQPGCCTTGYPVYFHVKRPFWGTWLRTLQWFSVGELKNLIMLNYTVNQITLLTTMTLTLQTSVKVKVSVSFST